MEFEIDTRSSVNTAEIKVRNEALISRGRVFVICIATFVLLMSMTTILFYVMNAGFGRLPAQAIRFALGLVLLIFLFQGQKWAQIVLAILLALGACGALLGIALLTQAEEGPINPVGVGLMGIMGIEYGTSAALLIFSSSIARFLAHQRGQPMG